MTTTKYFDFTTELFDLIRVKRVSKRQEGGEGKRRRKGRERFSSPQHGREIYVCLISSVGVLQKVNLVLSPFRWSEMGQTVHSAGNVRINSAGELVT